MNKINDYLIAAKCPQCGANIDVNKNMEQVFCIYCGTKIIVNNITKNVNISNMPTLQNYLKLADREYDDKNYDEALERYKMALSIDPDNIKAIVRKGILLSILKDNPAYSVKSAKNSFKILNSLNISERNKEIMKLNQIVDNVNFLYEFNNNSEQKFNLNKYDKDYILKYRDDCKNLIDLMFYFEDQIAYIKDSNIKSKTCQTKDDISCIISKFIISKSNEICKSRQYIKSDNTYGTLFVDKGTNMKYFEIYNRAVRNIHEIDKNYIPPKFAKTQGCYIATCVYGSYDCPEVWTLRRFRDYSLDKSYFGKIFIKVYYLISPIIVKIFKNSKIFNYFTKFLLDQCVCKLNKKGIQNTLYDDKY